MPCPDSTITDNQGGLRMARLFAGGVGNAGPGRTDPRAVGASLDQRLLAFALPGERTFGVRAPERCGTDGDAGVGLVARSDKANPTPRWRWE